jgi:hypothetical protein
VGGLLGCIFNIDLKQFDGPLSPNNGLGLPLHPKVTLDF